MTTDLATPMTQKKFSYFLLIYFFNLTFYCNHTVNLSDIATEKSMRVVLQMRSSSAFSRLSLDGLLTFYQIHEAKELMDSIVFGPARMAVTSAQGSDVSDPNAAPPLVSTRTEVQDRSQQAPQPQHLAAVRADGIHPRELGSHVLAAKCLF